MVYLSHINKISVTFLAGILCFSINAQVPLGVPKISDIEYPEDQPPAKELVTLGQKLFFDKMLSSNQTQSCATCHNPNKGFADGLRFSIGATGIKTIRNTPSLYNLAWNSVFNWDGSHSSLEEQALEPISSVHEMNMPIKTLMDLLNNDPYYQNAFKQALSVDTINAENIGQALAAFQRTIVTNNSAFDRYFSGDLNALTSSQKNGLKLFQGKAQCDQCHDGVNFTSEGFHNIGVNSADRGRGQLDYLSDIPELAGAFKTPTLRNVSLTSPYMHNGSIGTLRQVIEFYNRGGDKQDNIDEMIAPLNLTELEVDDLLNFLQSLTQQITIDGSNKTLNNE
jgi:cytochrome c peroxidase